MIKMEINFKEFKHPQALRQKPVILNLNKIFLMVKLFFKKNQYEQLI